METLLSRLQLDQTQAPRAQAQSFIRELILTGQLRPGDRLPSTESLATRWGTYVPAVHAALTSLVKEGLLIRQHGRGTFVRQRADRLTCVGLYCAENFWSPGSSEFQQALHAALKEELQRLGIEMRVWIDPRSRAEQGMPWGEFVAETATGRFQAVIVTGTSWPHYRWLSKLPIPTAFVTSANVPNAVSGDLAEFVRRGVSALADQGCRSVGLMHPSPTTPTDHEGMPNQYTVVFESFVEVCRERGLEFRNEWVFAHTPDLCGKSDEQQGFELFHKLWRLPQRPQGLLVGTDVHARGVIASALQQQVRVPAQLKLAIQKNARVELFCPFPATFIVFDEDETVRRLISLVERQFRGEEVQRQVVGCHLVAHPGTGPATITQTTVVKTTRKISRRGVPVGTGVASASASARERKEPQPTPAKRLGEPL